jgi:AcrR family transcriptional regulator
MTIGHSLMTEGQIISLAIGRDFDMIFPMSEQRIVRPGNKRKRSRRAHSLEAKTARREDILYAAMKLFGSKPIESISMDEIAQFSGIAKGTLYLYFRTKEEVFLALLQRSYAQWLDRFDAWLEGEGSAATAAEWIARSLSLEKRLLRLLAALHGSFEQNLEADAVREFKSWQAQRLDRTSERIAQKFEGITKNASMRFMLQVQCLAIGVFLMSHPSQKVAAILREKNHEKLRVDFESLFKATLAAVVRDLSP